MVTPRLLIYFIILSIVAIYGMVNLKRLSFGYKNLLGIVVLTIINEFILRNKNISIELLLLSYQILIPSTLFLNLIIYMSIVKMKKQVRNAILLLGGLSISLILLNSILYQKNVFPSYSLAVLSLMVIFLSLFTFKQMLKYPASIKLIRNEVFWFSFSNLFFYTITFFSFLLFNYYSNVSWINEVNVYSNFALYIGYFLAIYFNANNTIKHE